MDQRTILQTLGAIAAVLLFVGAIVQLARGNPLGGGLLMVSAMLALLLLWSRHHSR